MEEQAFLRGIHKLRNHAVAGNFTWEEKVTNWISPTAAKVVKNFPALEEERAMKKAIKEGYWFCLEDIIRERQILLKMFADWSLEEEHYLEY